MNQRGQYGTAPQRHDRYGGRSLRATVGSQPPWTPEVADQAFRQIDAEMEAIVDATYRAMGVDPAAIRKPIVADAAWTDRVRAATAKAKQNPLWPYWESSVSPKYGDWHAQGKSAINSWEDYDRWLARVVALRADAKAKGIKIETPDPVSLLSAGDGGSIGKWGAIGALAIGAVVAGVALAASSSRH